MSNSPLVTYTKISPNKTSPRNHEIDTITIHCTAGNGTARHILNLSRFVKYDKTYGASCNYCVGNDGSIGLCVDEGDRSWCSSSRDNDHRAITIEVSSTATHPYTVTDQAYNALIELLVDICHRNNITKLKWKGDKSLIGNVSKQNMTVHRWFANKACPGDYLYSRHTQIADAVNARLAEYDTSDPKRIWDYMKQKIGNEYGVAGLMGNLQAESGLYSDRVQGDIPYSSYSQDYTAQVDSGTISEYDFVHNGPNGGGYGLAQWTYYSRKQALYDMYKSGGYVSIGSLELALDYLWYELEHDFPGVLKVLREADSVREASNKVLHDFERPADQSTTVENTRESLCVAWYEKYTGTSYNEDTGNGAPGYQPGLTDNGNKKRMSLLLLATATKRGVK